MFQGRPVHCTTRAFPNFGLSGFTELKEFMPEAIIQVARSKVAAVQFANRRTRCGPRTGPGSVLNPGPVRLDPVQAGPQFRLTMNFADRLNQV